MAQVYLLRLGDTDYFKVGMTTNIDGRLAALQTATPFDLRLIAVADQQDAYAVEHDIHSALAVYRVRNEWFQCEQAEILRIFDVINAMSIIDHAIDSADTDEAIVLSPVRNFEKERQGKEDEDRDARIIECLRSGMNREQIRAEITARGWRTNNDRITELRARIA